MCVSKDIADKSCKLWGSHFTSNVLKYLQNVIRSKNRNPNGRINNANREKKISNIQQGIPIFNNILRLSGLSWKNNTNLFLNNILTQN